MDGDPANFTFRNIGLCGEGMLCMKKKILLKKNSSSPRKSLQELLQVISSVRSGDFTVRMKTVHNDKIIKEIADVLNDVIKLNELMANEFVRVRDKVGQEGLMTERISLSSVKGSWATGIQSINLLIGDLVQPTTEVARVITSVAKGDLSQKMTLEIDGRIIKGDFLRIGNTVNQMVDQLNSFASEVTRVAKEVGTEGKLGGQAQVKGALGIWRDLTDNVNGLASNLTNQVRNIAKVTTAVAKGDLSQKITVDARGEIFELKNTINTMVDQLRSFAAEVTRVAKDVGTEGKLGGQADVRGVSGTWKNLTDNVNGLANNLTAQVRNIAKVTTAVANGDLSQKITVDAKGEILELKNTINTMVGTLRSFAAEVTRVAKEVGTEGKLGGQADVHGVSGTWKDLTDNVNGLANNLTAQVRAIAEVSTAVTKGDLTRSISVEAQGEVAALKNNINQMISNLKDTTEKNKEQDWLKTNLAKFSGMMQGQRSITAVAQLIMSELSPLIGASQGTFFLVETENDEVILQLIACYAFSNHQNASKKYRLKEGLIGQCAFEKKPIILEHPNLDYSMITSSLVELRPENVIVLPVLFKGELKAVIELSSVKMFNQNYVNFLYQLVDSIGVILNMISSSMRTEELLQELKRSNIELEAQAKELEDKAKLLEVKNHEVELASFSLEEKAEQLSLISKYKSEFLANMSHELRTPLNSLLILSKNLANNKEKNLTPEQVKFATTVYSSGQDLLALINEILDLSKVETGKMPVSPKDISVEEIEEYLEQTFRPVAENKSLNFEIKIHEKLNPQIFSDENRLQQILKNLLSNAFKFTEKGSVRLDIEPGDGQHKYALEHLNNSAVVLFKVSDTGIGIPEEKQDMIFEAFQQADGTTSRKYGGTGLGLTISREIARLLGGIIEVESDVDKGSTFTLILPVKYFSAENNEPLIAQAEGGTRIADLPADVTFKYYKILVVDDDMRNIFALTSVLKSYEMDVIYAENGIEGLQILKSNPDTDLVLMDTMMPEMDGLEATRRIRKMPEFLNLPIISLTAKAMKGDREKCLEAGASDYITKPVEEKNLLAIMYTWLKKNQNLSEHQI